MRLMGLGFFKDVKVNKEPGSAGDRVVLNLDVQEQSTGELSFSAGYSTAEGVIGDISYSERNFMGTGQFVQVKLSGSQVSYGLDTSWTDPRFLDRNLSLGVDAFVRNADYTGQRRLHGGGLPGLQAPVAACASASACSTMSG